MSRSNQGPGVVGGLGRVCYRHRFATLISWIALVAALVTLWTRYGAAADNAFAGSDPGQALLSQHFPRQSGDTLTLAIRSSAPVTDPAVRDRVGQAVTEFVQAPDVTSVTSPYAGHGQIAADGHIAYATVQFSVPGSSISGGEAKALMNDATRASGNGVTFSLGGDVVDQAETPYGGPSNGIGVGAAMVVLLLVFGSLLAMALPVGTALFGIGAGLSVMALLGHVFPAPAFTIIIAALIGLGVGVDYALFIVTRFRSELRSGAGPQEAVVTAMRTAGHSVLTAGTTVVIGMLGLLVLQQQLLNGVAIAAASTVAMTVLAAITLLPALLRLTGTRLASPPLLARMARKSGGGTADGRRTPAAASEAGAREKRAGRSEKWASHIQRHRIAAALAAMAVTLVLAAPALAMRLAMPDESAQAHGTMGYASYAAMAQGFGPGFDAPLVVVTEHPAQAAGIETTLRAVPGIAGVTPPVTSRDGQAALLIAYPATGEQDAATSALASRVESSVLPPGAYLTGPNAANITFTNVMASRLPWLVGTVVALSMVLLLVVFRALVIPVKAALMNLLSVSAAYGVLTAVTQWGWGSAVLGFPEKMPVTTWVPVFLFVILFGLSMDYEVFLLSSVKEAYDESGDNSAAVARGLSGTLRVISAAAAIMVVVFFSSVITPDVGVKQIGLGLAVAVLIDATVIRLMLVPALMELLGNANWWLPFRRRPPATPIGRL